MISVLNGETVGTSFMQFTAKGFGRSTPLHEAGHLLRHSAVREIGTKSKEAADEAAEIKNIPKVAPRGMIADMSAVQKAAVALRDSDGDDSDAKAALLDDVVMASEAYRMGPEIGGASNAKDLLAGYDRLDKWVETVRALAKAKAKGLQ